MPSMRKCNEWCSKDTLLLIGINPASPGFFIGNTSNTASRATHANHASTATLGAWRYRRGSNTAPDGESVAASDGG